MQACYDVVKTEGLQDMDVDKTIQKDLIFHNSISHAGILKSQIFIFLEHILIGD